MSWTDVAATVMVAGVPEHAHCEICAKPIEVGNRRCGSEACEAKFAEALKAKKRSVYILLGVLMAAMLMSLFGRSLIA